MKVFVRVKNMYDPMCCKEVPYNVNIAAAMQGFHEMGFEIVTYHTVDEIYDIYEKGDIVLDGISQVEYCLNKFGLSFPSIDYPECLEKYLGRQVWKDTINHINTHPELWGNFVKPVKEKVFTGKVINSPQDLIGCGSCYEDYEVLVSEPLDIVFEVRGLVYYDDLLDLRPYRGDWAFMNKIDTTLIKSAMEDWKKWDDRPMGCTLDWGVVRKKSPVTKTFDSKYKSKYSGPHNTFIIDDYVYETVLIEANAGISFGPYCTNTNTYAKIISAAMSKVSGTKDECYFGPILR